MRRLYADTAAGTPVDRRVARMMARAGRCFGNPSSLHAEGRAAARLLRDARERVAGVLGAHADEIVFTSGGTEGNVLALRGLIGSGMHIIISAVEHPSVMETARVLEREGAVLTVLPVDRGGRVAPQTLAAALRPETKLVSIMYANNEIGTVEPIRDLAKTIRAFRKQSGSALPYFHVDACQAPRFLPLGVDQLGVDLLTLNGSKIYGPHGSGALFVRRGVPLNPVATGGGQEDGRRSGTESVAAAVGLATALEICARERETERIQLTAIRDEFIECLVKLGAALNGDALERLPNNVNVYFPGVLAEQLVIELDAEGIACSTGSACAIPARDESHVVRALGFDADRAESSVRFSFGRDLTLRQITFILKVLPPILERLRTRPFAA